MPVAAGGNIGTAALALALLPDDGVYVLEMSSYMLERIATLRFDAAVMLNITPDHLDRHGDMAGYVAAKRAIFAARRATTCRRSASTTRPSREMADGCAGRTRRPISAGAARATSLRGRRAATTPTGAICDLPTRRRCPARTMRRTPRPPPRWPRSLGMPRRGDRARHRAAFPAWRTARSASPTIDGVRFVNDSKATNADAAARALACYDRV